LGLVNLSLDDNKELYFEIVKETQPKVNKCFSEIRAELIKFLGAKRIGIFGPYRDVIQEVQVKKIIQFLAVNLAGQGFTVITGKGIYVQHSIKTEMLNKFFKLITALKPEIAVKNLYKFLVTLAPNAIFIETNSRSSSLFEEETFYDNIYLDNEFGIGFLILENNLLECFNLSKQEVDSIHYWLCKGTIPKHCEDNKGKCPFYHAQMNYAAINMFVISEFMQLGIAKDFRHIPMILSDLMKTD